MNKKIIAVILIALCLVIVLIKKGKAWDASTDTVSLSFKTAAEWSGEAPILCIGCIGVESDTSLFKFGDGNTAWGSLSYAGQYGLTTSDSPTFAGLTSSGSITGNVVGNIKGNLSSTGTATAGGVVSSGTVTAAGFTLSALNTAPATSVSPGTAGMVRIDASNIYVCTSTNSWKRAAISSW